MRPPLTVLYASSLFLSAFLLFSVQPMVGKYLLPLMGGGPSVWNTAMVFFQILLLGGYAYAHGMARFLPVRTQMLIHGGLFCVAGASLPLALAAGADPTGHNPFLWQLTAMLGMAAVPFFVLSSTAPLLQHWFTKSRHERSDNPYFLYAASNAGSLIGLLAYPFLIEPLLTLKNQSLSWSWGYVLLGIVIAGTALLSKPQSNTQVALEEKNDADSVTWKQRATWIFLAFVPSSLMLGLTSYITTDVTTVPLFWVVPLALYILSFIIAFSEKPFFPLTLTRILQGGATVVLLISLTLGQAETRWSYVIIHLLFFFFSALLCHQELSALKPKSRHLTEFYLLMSFGGALGGLFNSLLAPLIFLMPFEYTFAMIFLLFCRYMADPEQIWKKSVLPLREWNFQHHWSIGLILILSALAGSTLYRAIDLVAGIAFFFVLTRLIQTRWAFAFVSLFIMAANPLIPWSFLKDNLVIHRNYYGIVRVWDSDDVRVISHGTTNHGGQAIPPEHRFTPLSYYGRTSGLSDVFQTGRMAPSLEGDRFRIGVIGLGTGSISCFFNRPDFDFEYFEIDSSVISIATNPEYFTFLSDCGVSYKIHEGDGRLLISKEPDASYDMIVVDAFSSDNIPIHVMTQEAVAMYRKKLRPGGILIFHISNRFFNLEYELAAISQSTGMKYLYKLSRGSAHLKHKEETHISDQPTKYVVLTDNDQAIEDLAFISKEWHSLDAPASWKPWSDDYASILRSMVFR